MPPRPAASPPEAPPVPDSGRPLHVAFDVRMLKNSGIGSYIAGLLQGMADIEAPVEWTFVGPKTDMPKGLRARMWIDFRAPLYSREEYRRYPALRDADVFHYPHYNMPPNRARARVVTFHDAFHTRYGGFAKRLYQSWFLTRLRWSRTRVVAVSEKSAEDLLALTGISRSRVAVVRSGPGRAQPDPRRPIPPPALTSASGAPVRPPWLLAVGIDQPHKNMEFLMAAVAMWRLRRDGTPPLVWVGAPADRIPALRAKIPAHARETIHLEPYREGDAIEGFYAGASALVFPSLDEGFGMPPIEAMARGIPAICARRRPMTDLLGDAPIWFDPEDSSTLWRALDCLMDEEDYVQQVVRRGLHQSLEFSWEKTARETLDVWMRAARGRSRTTGAPPTAEKAE